MRRSAPLPFALALVPVLGLACGQVQLPMTGGGDHLVDSHEFDPSAGVLWAEGGKPSGDDLKKAHPLFLMDVTVIDGTGGPAKPHQDLLIDKGRIVEINATGEIVPPKGSEKIKGTGWTVMPGLVDIAAFAVGSGGPLWDPGKMDEERFAEANLYAGVTTVVAGGDPEKLADLRDRIKKGEVMGPQMFLLGPMVTVKNGYPAELGKHALVRLGAGPDLVREILNPSDAKAKINEIADNKAKFDVIPIVYDATPAEFPKMSVDSLKVCIDRTRTRGRLAIVLTSKVDDAAIAASSKVAAIVHGVYTEELDEDKATKLAQLMALSGVPLIPGLADLWGRGMSVAGQAITPQPLDKEIVDPDQFTKFATVPKKLEGMMVKHAQSLGPQVPVAAANILKLSSWKGEGGTTLSFVAGSFGAGPALVPGAALHKELALMVKAGVSPTDAIAAATGRAARLLREDKADFGTLVAGKRADLFAVEGDVVADINNTQKIKLLVVGGRVLDRFAAGTYADKMKARKAAAAKQPAAAADEAPDDGGKAAGKPGDKPAGKDAKGKKKKKSTGADEDPTPLNE